MEGIIVKVVGLLLVIIYVVFAVWWISECESIGESVGSVLFFGGCSLFVVNIAAEIAWFTFWFFIVIIGLYIISLPFS